jgi:hypothetical protein
VDDSHKDRLTSQVVDAGTELQARNSRALVANVVGLVGTARDVLDAESPLTRTNVDGLDGGGPASMNGGGLNLDPPFGERVRWVASTKKAS